MLYLHKNKKDVFHSVSSFLDSAVVGSKSEIEECWLWVQKIVLVCDRFAGAGRIAYSMYWVCGLCLVWDFAVED